MTLRFDITGGGEGGLDPGPDLGRGGARGPGQDPGRRGRRQCVCYITGWSILSRTTFC